MPRIARFGYQPKRSCIRSVFWNRETLWGGSTYQSWRSDDRLSKSATVGVLWGTDDSTIHWASAGRSRAKRERRLWRTGALSKSVLLRFRHDACGSPQHAQHERSAEMPIFSKADRKWTALSQGGLWRRPATCDDAPLMLPAQLPPCSSRVAAVKSVLRFAQHSELHCCHVYPQCYREENSSPLARRNQTLVP